MYKPELAVDISMEHNSQIFLGIQGPPGCGKTTAALTFPNPVVINWDRGLRGHVDRKDVIQFPMYDKSFITDKLGIKPAGSHKLPNITKAIECLLHDHCSKLEKDQTLVWDTWSSHQDAFDAWNTEVPYYTDKGKIDEYEAWDVKLKHARKVHDLFRSLPCNVLVLFHISQMRDKESGRLLDKEQPLMTGKFTAELKKNYPFFFKMFVREGSDKQTEWVWQTKSDNTFDAKCCTPVGDKIPNIIPAKYEVLAGYLAAKI
jgi:hypothetical protein